MKAQEHTKTHINFYKSIGITALDFATIERKESDPLIVHKHGINIDEINQKFFGWLYAMNRKNHNIYVRPTIKHALHPYLFFDDLLEDVAFGLAKRYKTQLINTSREGGYQAWVQTDKPIAQSHRKHIQLSMRDALGADPYSISGEHLGRLAGFRNPKRGWQWCNTMPLTDAPLFPVSSVELPEPELKSCPCPIQVTDDKEREIINALNKINANDCDYGGWLRIGMALHSIQRKDLWDNWASSSHRYIQANQDRYWNNMKGTGITIRTLFWYANQA